MSAPRISYSPRPDATVETEEQVLAAVYRFILDCHAKKKAGGISTGDDARKEIKNDSRATYILP
jgi:hypothetical protein